MTFRNGNSETWPRVEHRAISSAPTQGRRLLEDGLLHTVEHPVPEWR